MRNVRWSLWRDRDEFYNTLKLANVLITDDLFSINVVYHLLLFISVNPRLAISVGVSF